jgi:hypothetical protein
MTICPTRSKVLPDVPAMSEFVPGYEAGSWFGLGAPRGMPGRVVEALNAAVNDGLADQAVRARFRQLVIVDVGAGQFVIHRQTRTPERLEYPGRAVHSWKRRCAEEDEQMPVWFKAFHRHPVRSTKKMASMAALLSLSKGRHPRVVATQQVRRPRRRRFHLRPQFVRQPPAVIADRLPRLLPFHPL